MCGLVGVITKNQYGFSKENTDVFTHMLWCDAIRGYDSTGLFLVNKYGDVDWQKTRGQPAWLFQHKDYEEVMDAAFKEGRFLIGHNRKATSGVINDENAHPFVEDNVILVHNGAMYNHKKHADVEVDSHAIAHMIKEKGNETALKEIDGAFALIWYDINTKKLHLARNDKRPLNILETSTSWYIGSEMEMLEWMQSRVNTKIISKRVLDPGVLYTIDIENTDKIEERKVELYSPKPFLPTGPVGGTQTTTTENTTGKERTIKSFSIGDKIIFEMDDYVDTANSDYDGMVLGKVSDDPTIQVRCHFKNEDWKHFTDSGMISGKLQRIFSHDNLLVLWLEPGSLQSVIEINTLNNYKIDEIEWQSMGHKCFKCKTDVTFYDLDKCIVNFKLKRGSSKTFCPTCSSKIVGLAPRGDKHSVH